VRAVERYKWWVSLVRSGSPEQVRIAVESMETRQDTVGLSGGEARLLERARRLLSDIGED
jgi:hypothetical protein